MAAAFRGLLELLGQWLSAPSSIPPVTPVAGHFAVSELPLNVTVSEARNNFTVEETAIVS